MSMMLPPFMIASRIGCLPLFARDPLTFIAVKKRGQGTSEAQHRACKIFSEQSLPTCAALMYDLDAAPIASLHAARCTAAAVGAHLVASG